MAILGIRYDFRNPAIGGATMAERYSAALDQIEWADKLGFESLTLSEHHGSDDGYLPSPLVFAAAAAARSQNMRIRIAALIVPLHDPLRVAEDLAVLDNVSNGRLDVIFANGYVPAEFEMFGVEMSDRVPRLVEAVETMRAAWTGEPFEYRGKTVTVTPTPAQSPGVPIWMGGSSEKAARRAARIADMFIPSLPEFWDVYRDELAKLGKPDVGPMPPGSASYVHVSSDADAAWEQILPHAMHEMNAYGKWAAESGAATGYQPVEDPEALKAIGMYQVMTPEECVDHIKGLGDYGSFMLHPLMGGIHPDVAWENLRTFEEQVLPHVR